MSKLFKFIGRFVGITFEWILILFIAFAFFIRTSEFQTFLAQKLASYLSKELNTTIKIDKVDVLFFDRVALDGVLVLDQKADTLLSVATVYANIDAINLKENSYKIGKAELEKGISHIYKDKKSGTFNFQFLADYFKNDKPKPKGEPIKLAVEVLALNELAFKFDDNQIETKPFGIDYAHLHLKPLKVELSQFNFGKDKIGLHIDNLAAKEKCGLEIQNWTSDVMVSPKGVRLDNVDIKTKRSNIFIKKFHLLTDRYESFKSFNDSVIFDAEILKSKVSTADIAYFVPALEGMNQTCTIQTKIKSKLSELLLENLIFKTGKKNQLKGTFRLPDFRNVKSSKRKQLLHYAYFDLSEIQKIKLPKSAKKPFLNLDASIASNLFIELKEVNFEGSVSNFKLKCKKLETANGKLNLENGVLINSNDDFKSFDFHPVVSNKPMVVADDLNLKAITGSNQLGVFNGQIRLDGAVGGKDKLKLENIFGAIDRIDLSGYSYQSILIDNSSFINEIINGKVRISDPNLKAKFDGFVDLGKNKKINCNLDLINANLGSLNITKSSGISLQSNFDIDISGFDPKLIKGTVKAKDFKYIETNKSFSDSLLNLEIIDLVDGKKYTLKSSIADVTIDGKVNFQTIGGDLISQFNKVFPSDITGLSQDKVKSKNPSQFTYNIQLKKINDFLSIFAPDLTILGTTNIHGNYDGLQELFKLKINSEKLKYQEIVFDQVACDQDLLKENVTADYKVNNIELTDSIHLEIVHFRTNGTQRNLESFLSWDTLTPNTSYINWTTNLTGKNKLNFKLKPSFFAINKLRWDIEKESDIGIEEQQVIIRNLKLQRGKQIISLNGALSKNTSDVLTYKLKEIDLEDISQFFGSKVKLKGVVNGYGSLSKFYTDLTYEGDLFINGLYVNEAEIGNLFVLSDWNKSRESIALEGDLMFRNNKTCQFKGDYFTNRDKNSLAFDINFNNTDIRFVQDFLDASTISNLKGTLFGTIEVSGTPSDPKIKGDVQLNEGNIKLELLGANFGLNGKISISDNLIYIKKMNLIDELNGKGTLEAKVIHNNFTNWNYRLDVDLAPGNFSLNQNVSDRFLIMNTAYKEGEIYHGTAFVKGSATIFGTTKETTIDVDVETRKGSSIYFPMYGQADLKEDKGFMTFGKISELNAKKETLKEEIKEKHSLIMDLNFKVTPDAKMKIIFNQNTNDEITANGNGDINMKINRMGDLTMNGIYTIKEGKYNFAMGPVYRQEFAIDEGGTIAWKGDPTQATLDIKTKIDVIANLAELSPNEINNTGNSRQKVNCYLLLTDKLTAPRIDFDIKAPKADETGKALIARVTSDKDELKRQFVSLIFWKRFQPLKGTATASGSAALDLVTNQINSLLSQISNDYRMGVNMDKDEITKESTYEFGVSKGFLDNRLIVSGSFGVESNTGNSGSENALIGDVSLEYLLNESGTVRVNVFNESNDNSIIKDKNLGLFTQGAGFNYQEEFDNFENFKLGQYFLDIFRAKDKKKYPVKRKKQQTPVPTLNEPSGAVYKNEKRKV